MTEAEAAGKLKPGDTIIDGGNSYYKDDIRRANVPGVFDVVPCFECVAVYHEAPVPEFESLISGRAHVLEHVRHTIPCCYEMGDDLEDVARLAGLSVDQLIEIHSGAPFTCEAVGFQPGFAYLGSLPDRCQAIPRLDTPRLTTPAGAIGIAGRLTGIYPSASPGGWRIVGRTPLRVAAPESLHFPIAVGHTVKFQRISEQEYTLMEGDSL